MIRATLEEWPDVKAPRMTDILREVHGYAGSVDLVKRKLGELRPPRERRERSRIGPWARHGANPKPKHPLGAGRDRIVRHLAS